MWEGATGWDYVDEDNSEGSQGEDDGDDDEAASSGDEGKKPVARKTAARSSRGKGKAVSPESDMDVDYDDE